MYRSYFSGMAKTSTIHEIFRMKTLHRFLHSLLTLLFSLLVYIPYYFKLTKRKLRNSISCQPTLNDIKEDISTLRSLPRHISFLVLEPDIDICILVRLVVWSVAAGISYVSVFDPKGKRLDSRILTWACSTTKPKIKLFK